MLKRTSVLLEFDDEVFDAVVEPMKKNKSFSKLVATLVEGYLTDSYIRAFAEDGLESMRKAAVSAFSQSIDSMTESLSNMGLYTDELDSVSLKGKTVFKDMADNQRKELADDGNNSVPKSEVDKIYDYIDSMKKELYDAISEGFTSTLNSIKEQFIPQESNKDNVKKSVENVKSDVSDSVEPDVKKVVVSDEDKKQANDFMMSMLDGNSFEY